MFYIGILIILFNVRKILSTADVQLSIENSTKLEYVGHVWSNSKFVFLTPHLRAVAVKGRSLSEKICGFELSNPLFQSVPFMVYLIDELSGLGEIQVKPDVELDHQTEMPMRLTVEAYDCDNLPHYSDRANVVIHISALVGPRFTKKSYSFTLRKNSPIGTVIGKVKAKGVGNRSIKYSLFHADVIPFGIDGSGTIRTLSTLSSMNNSLIYFRVVATDESKSIPTRSIASITVEILPKCETKLNGIPDQLDYKIKNGMMDAERLIQEQHQPHLIICTLPSPFKQIRLSISLVHSHSSSLQLLDKHKVCETDITTNKWHRQLCKAPTPMIDLFTAQGGIINLDEEMKTIGSEVLPFLKKEFTLTWWMKREIKRHTNLFCLKNKDHEELASISIVDCTLIISISGRDLLVSVPTELCIMNSWIFYTVSQQGQLKPSLRITVADQILPPVSINVTIPQQNSLRFFVGQCSSSIRTISSQFPSTNHIQIGIISLSNYKSLSTATVGCMSTCGEALLLSESMKKMPNTISERRGSSLSFTSTDIPEIIKVLSKIEYINSFHREIAKPVLDNKQRTKVAIDISIDCKSGETIAVPVKQININIIRQQREPTNETIEVELYASTTVLTKNSQSIRLFSDFRFVSSVNEEPIKRVLKMEGCSIRPLQRNFIVNEKIYLTRLMMPLVTENLLQIRSDPGSWNLDGDGTMELYESLIRHVSFDMVNERRKLYIICTLKGGESTSQAFVDVILQKKEKTERIIVDERNSKDFVHNSLDERKRMFDRSDGYLKDHFDITKFKFIVIVIMAAVGGATWAVVTVAISCFIIKRRGNLLSRHRMKLNDIKTYQRELSPTFQTRPSSSSNPTSVCNHYEYDEDRISMADIPDADEHCLDNISCDTCDMVDHDQGYNNHNTIKDIPRSITVNFPIIHKRF